MRATRTPRSPPTLPGPSPAPTSPTHPRSWTCWLSAAPDTPSVWPRRPSRTQPSGGTGWTCPTTGSPEFWTCSTAPRPETHSTASRHWPRTTPTRGRGPPPTTATAATGGPPETIARAALGLRSLCDATDLHAAALLGDPLHRRAAVHSGHVTVGTSTAVEGKRKCLTLTSDRLDSRLRAGEAVQGRVGGPLSNEPVFTGTVRESEVEGGRLAVLIDGVTGAGPKAGETVSVHQAPPNAHAQRRGRGSIGRLYATRRSWLATGRAPQPTRRDVPLDVLVAAADND